MATNNVDRGYKVRADEALTEQIASTGRPADCKAIAMRRVDGGARPASLLNRLTVIEALKTEAHFRVIRLAEGSIHERRGRVV